MVPNRPPARADLARDLTALGLGPRGCVMVHAALGRVGRVLGGRVDL